MERFTQKSLIGVSVLLASLGVFMGHQAHVQSYQVANAPGPIPSASIAQATPQKSGTFVSGEHETKGGVKLLNQGGKRVLQLDQNFSTFNMGPDLVVILHRSENVIASTKPPAHALKSGDYVILAPLQKFQGAQTYTIPENVNLANYPSVAIWCRKFNATFGAARLQ